MMYTTYKQQWWIRIVGKLVVFLLIVLLNMLHNGVAYAQDGEFVTLQDALANQQVEVQVIGSKDPDGGTGYNQPMLRVGIQNLSDTQLNLSLPPGSRFEPSPTSVPLVGLGFDAGIESFAPGERRAVWANAFPLEVAPFPSQADTFTLAPTTIANPELNDLLQKIEEQVDYRSSVVAPLAVWLIVQGECSTIVDAIREATARDVRCGMQVIADAEALVASVRNQTGEGTGTAGSDGATIPVDPDNPGNTDATTDTSDMGNTLFIIACVILFVFVVGIAFAFSQRQRQEARTPSTALTAQKPQKDEAQSVAPKSQPSKKGPNWKASPRSSFDVPTSAINPGGDQSYAQQSDAQNTLSEPPHHGKSTLAVATTPLMPANADKNKDTEPEDETILPAILAQPQLLLRSNKQPDDPYYTIEPNTLLSRDKVNQCVITEHNLSISAPHCVIRFDGSWRIIDLGSLNGTYVNGQQIKCRRRPVDALLDGCEVQLGTTRFLFECDTDGELATLTPVNSQKQAIAPPHEYDPNQGLYWVITSKLLQTQQTGDDTVSAPHALIAFEDGWKIRDLNSSSGVFVIRSNGTQTTVGQLPQRIVPGDTLCLSQRIKYQCNAPELPRVGGYMLQRWVGWGGASSVFLAAPPDGADDTQPRVIKLLRNKHFEAALQMECNVLQKLDNRSHIVPFETCGNDETYGFYIVLRYVSGATLQSILRTREKNVLPLADCVAVALPVCRGLAAIHKHGWLHCDVKPENILIDHHDGNVFLVDFGSVIEVGKKPRYISQLYSPPEFAAHATGETSVASDIYSLGAVMFEMLLGDYYSDIVPARDNVLVGTSKRQQIDQRARSATMPLTNQDVSTKPRGEARPRHSEGSAASFRQLINRCLRLESPAIKDMAMLEHELEAIQRQLATLGDASNLLALVPTDMLPVE